MSTTGVDWNKKSSQDCQHQTKKDDDQVVLWYVMDLFLITPDQVFEHWIVGLG